MSTAATRAHPKRKPIMTTAQESTPNNEPSGAQKLIGDLVDQLGSRRSTKG
jgi:hypothetical protein